jgi:hypothetical protein
MRLSVSIAALIFVVTGAVPGLAQTFDSGSTGADGALNPTADTQLQVPAGGVFNFTTVDIPSGVTVTFVPDAANSPVTLLASGNVTISGTISINGGNGAGGGAGGLGGTGGPGGYRGGSGTDDATVTGGYGLGPGGGTGSIGPSGSAAFAGGGSFGTQANNGGPVYGNTVLLPLVGGSGGGGGAQTSGRHGGGGGGGAGAILIGSSGDILIDATGKILAQGGNGGSASGVFGGGGGGGGSGGAIRMIATSITISGELNASGGTAGIGVQEGYNGGLGRVRLEAFTLSAGGTITPSPSTGLPSVLTLLNIPTLRITAIGGTSIDSPPQGALGGLDVQLPQQGGPTDIQLTGSNIASGTQVTITAVPQKGAPVTATGTLTGSAASTTATVSIQLPDGLNFIKAEVSF